MQIKQAGASSGFGAFQEKFDKMEKIEVVSKKKPCLCSRHHDKQFYTIKDVKSEKISTELHENNNWKKESPGKDRDEVIKMEEQMLDDEMNEEGEGDADKETSDDDEVDDCEEDKMLEVEKFSKDESLDAKENIPGKF